MAEWLRSGLQSRLTAYHPVTCSNAETEKSKLFADHTGPLSYPMLSRPSGFGGNLGGNFFKSFPPPQSDTLTA